MTENISANRNKFGIHGKAVKQSNKDGSNNLNGFSMIPLFFSSAQHLDSYSLVIRAVKMVEGKNFAHLATLMPDGSPQVTPVWVNYDDGLVLINATGKRIKYRNVKSDSRVALSIIDSEDPYTMLAIRGRDVQTTTTGADEHIEKLSMKYMGKRFPWKRPTSRSVLF